MKKALIVFRYLFVIILGVLMCSCNQTVTYYPDDTIGFKEFVYKEHLYIRDPYGGSSHAGHCNCNKK